MKIYPKGTENRKKTPLILINSVLFFFLCFPFMVVFKNSS